MKPRDKDSEGAHPSKWQTKRVDEGSSISMRHKLTLIHGAFVLVALYSFCSTLYQMFWIEEARQSSLKYQSYYDLRMKGSTTNGKVHSLQLHQQDLNKHSAHAQTKEHTINQHNNSFIGLYDQIQRFPKWGTQEFSEKCSFTVKYKQPREAKCVFFNRPRPKNNEGMAMWISDTATAFFGARLADCALVFDYGPDVDILDVLNPDPKLSSLLGDIHYNWVVPTGFNCSSYGSRCFPPPYTPNDLEKVGRSIQQQPLPQIPNYRFAYKSAEHFWLYLKKFGELQQALPGFKLETGMACSLGSLFHLSPKASQFEPDLYTKILPTLNDKNALVIALYIRTGLTDEKAKMEQNEQDIDEEKLARKYFSRSKAAVECSKRLEQNFLVENVKPVKHFSRAVWMVLTDAPTLKKWIFEKYNGQHLTKNIQREVVITSSHGTHTRPQRKPSTADFAEAFLDWYLIGESDIVIADIDTSFGATAALRTARPFLDADCSQRVLVH